MTSGLPIETALPALRAALAAHASVVLVAPPGAGKSTVVPLALLAEPWAEGKRIVMLEPRRLAARAVARRMASVLGEDVGRTVGYRMRLDTRVSSSTRVEVVTEGVLARMLQSDPALEGVALLVFDEFHERSLQADLGLALALDARAALAPELKVLVMSATLEAEPLIRLLGDAELVRSEGRTFPVETRYVGKGPPVLPGAGATLGESPERVVASAVQRALAETEGDVLVFLPGAREIRRVQALLEDGGVRASVLPLFGDLDAAAQDAALAPSPPGKRKVVLATNIAETSLTIEGVRVVVDSGLARFSSFDPATGMGRLETRRISRASAEQRQGRAGRTAPGVCYRCWSESAHRSLVPATPPEVLSADLVPLALEVACWGASAEQLQWLDPPPAPMLASARDLLQRLGALDAAGRVTSHGRAMARLGVHPRLAHMLLRGREIGAGALAAELAALLSERDMLRGAAGRDADVRTRLDALRGESGMSGDRAARQRARRLAAELQRELGVPGSREARPDDSLVGVLLAFAYPDRIGRRRPGAEARYTLANGRGAHFAEAQSLARSELIVAVELDDRDRDARILLAAPLELDDLLEHFAGEIERVDGVEWSSREQAVLARRTVRLGGLTLVDNPLPQVPREAAAAAMLAGVRELGIEALPWTEEARELQARIEFARRIAPEKTADWPAADDASLERTLEEWLAPWLDGVTRKADLARIDLAAVLAARLTYGQQRMLDELAPQWLTVPSGSQIKIDYRDENAPVVAVRLQEVFGLTQSPRLGGGKAPVTFKLLSPGFRPVQITRDLASFWRSGYAEVRKDLRGRYPKHYWPDDPLQAEPTRGVRRRPPGR